MGVEYEAELLALLAERNAINMDGSRASATTRKERKTYLMGCFKYLREIGYGVTVGGLKDKHIVALLRRHEREGLSPATIRNYISHLNNFCVWIDKPGMIADPASYFSEGYLNGEAVEEESDAQIGDPQQLLKELKENDQRIWLILHLTNAFGLTRKEAVSLRPAMAVGEGELRITDNTRHMRTIKIESAYKQAVIDTAKKEVGDTSSMLKKPGMTIPQTLRKIRNVLHRNGMGGISQDALEKALCNDEGMMV